MTVLNAATCACWAMRSRIRSVLSYSDGSPDQIAPQPCSPALADRLLVGEQALVMPALDPPVGALIARGVAQPTQRYGRAMWRCRSCSAPRQIRAFTVLSSANTTSDGAEHPDRLCSVSCSVARADADGKKFSFACNFTSPRD